MIVVAIAITGMGLVVMAGTVAGTAGMAVATADGAVVTGIPVAATEILAAVMAIPVAARVGTTMERLPRRVLPLVRPPVMQDGRGVVAIAATDP
jgi:hypothetical protein